MKLDEGAFNRVSYFASLFFSLPPPTRTQPHSLSLLLLDDSDTAPIP